MERSGAPGKAPTPWALHLTLVGAQLAFAAMAVSAHTALEHIPPLQFAAVRITLGLPGLAALAWREGGALTWRMAAWGVPLAVGMVGAMVLPRQRRGNIADRRAEKRKEETLEKLVNFKVDRQAIRLHSVPL